MVSQGMLSAACYNGVGNHVSTVTTHHTVPEAMKWSIISSAVVLFGIGTSKVAIIAFLLKVQGLTHRYLQSFLYFLAVTNLAFNTALPFVIMFQCNPPAAEWDKELEKTAKCRPSSINTTFGEFTAGWNAFTDLALAIYPTILFWNLKMPLKIKVGTSCLMGLGIFATGCAAAKGWAIHLIVTGHEDITYNTAPLWLLGMTELWICLIVASVPPLWPLVKQYLLGGRTTGKYGSRQTPNRDIGLKTIGGTGRASRHHPTSDRTDSLERILDLESEPREGIKMTKNVTVSYEDKTKPAGTRSESPTEKKKSPSDTIKSPLPMTGIPKTMGLRKKEAPLFETDEISSLESLHSDSRPGSS